MIKKKFKQGEVISRIDDLMKILIINKEWVYYKNRPKHPEFILHMQLKTVILGLTNRCFKKAIKLEEEKSDKKTIKSKTIKIVINTRRYGAFGLSLKAVKYLAQKKSKLIEKIPIEKWKMRPEEFKIDVGNGFKAHRFTKGLLLKNNILYVCNVDAHRTHPDLIEVVEKLGKEAWGDWAELKIIEIPDDVDWTICECNGIEWVAEKRRIWR